MVEVFKTYSAQHLADEKEIQVRGESLGDLRAAIRFVFGIPSFEQTISFSVAAGQFVEVRGDDTVLLAEKAGLLEATQLRISQQVDPRYKLEKETAFQEALLARRFQEAKDILSSSGIPIDVNCIHTYRIPSTTFQTGPHRIAVTECPCKAAHPALTVAIQAGLEHCVHFLRADSEKVRKFMSQEEEVAELVQLLIEKRADVNATGDETQDAESNGAPTVHGKSPLAAAIQRGSPMLVKVLLDAKADPNHQMKYDSCASGIDKQNPFGPGVLMPESWLDEVSNGSVHARGNKEDPRNQHREEILALLTAARTAAMTPAAMTQESEDCVCNITC